MYYEFSEFYKRDVYFVYSENNPVDWNEFVNGENKNVIQPIVYNVDKIDTYINTYDVLPTIGLPLVSLRFKEVFTDLISIDVDFSKTVIVDKKGIRNENFYILNEFLIQFRV